MKVEPRLPIGFDIRADCIDEEKDIWEMRYKETFKPEDREAFNTALKILEPLQSDNFVLSIVDNNSISIYVKNERTVIFSMLAAEFMANSEYGKMTILEMITYSSIGMMKLREIQNEEQY